MSRNKENNPLRTTARANGSLLSSSRTPQSDDFFTDSLLDASKIPTPSPKKQAFSAAYKGRRALGTARTLKDAWNATGSRNSSPEAQPSKSQVQSLKGSSTQPRRRSSLQAGHQIDRKVTPSPPRHKRPLEITSPASEFSSPPRGLTDVYQRIADEEDLAAQEGEIEEDDEYTQEEVMPEGVSVTGDELQNDAAYAPPFLQNSQKRTLDHYTEGVNKENLMHEEMTSMSDPSGMSFLQNLTDQSLAAKLTPHTIDRASDRARIDRAIQSEKPIAFRHGYRSMSGLTKENLLRNGSPAERFARPNSSTGSATTERSEPAPNVPRLWGTKSKAGKEWLKSRREGSANGVKSSPGPESSQVDWAAAAAEVALPPAEESSTLKGLSEESTPAPLQRQNSLDRIRQWELNDFTGQSLQISQSPPVRMRPSVQGHIRDKEIERLERQAVTTNRLGEIRERTSREHLRKSRSPSAAPPEPIEAEIEDANEKDKAVTFATNGEPIPDTPIVVYKSSSASSRSDTPAIGDEVTDSNGKAKSHEHLQRLARAMSNSPRASPSPEDWSLISWEEGSIKADKQRQGIDKQLPNGETSRKSSKEVAESASTPQVPRSLDTAKTPKVTGAWTDTILPETIKTIRKQEEKPAKYAQTPHVTAGGWVDTPITGRRHTSALAPIPLEDVPEELMDGIAQDSKSAPEEKSPAVPEPSTRREAEAQKSALATLLERAKRRLTSQDTTTTKDNDTLNLGEATLESLEDLLTLDATDMTTLIRLGAEAEAHDLLMSGHAKNDPVAEAQMLDRLSTKLERLRTNIHDARKGISKLEHQVSSSPPPSQQKLLSPGVGCDSCGCTGGALELTSSSPYRMYLAIPIPRLFHTPRRDLGQWLPRPTALGWMVIMIWCWYISECVMCELFSHPLYADHYDWPIETEPIFPFVLPTMLWRWTGIRRTGPVLLGPVWTLLVAFTRLIGQALGLTDGFVDSSFSSSPTVPPLSGVGGGIDMSMIDDEYM